MRKIEEEKKVVSLQYKLKNILYGNVWGFFNVLNNSCPCIGLGWVLTFYNSKEIFKISTKSLIQSTKCHRAKVFKYKAEQFRCDRPLISVTAQTLFPSRVLTSVSSFCSCQLCSQFVCMRGLHRCLRFQTAAPSVMTSFSHWCVSLQQQIT